MRVLWRIGEGSLADVVSGLEGQTEWKPRTIQSLLRRLVEKGAVRRVVEGRDHVYRPAVEEQACVHAASRTFLDRMFEGKLAPFLATFVGRAEITPEEIEELRKLLGEEERG